MSISPSDKTIAFIIKPFLFITCLVPLAWLVWGAMNDALGANPVETMTRETGEWVLRLLLITLTITPARKILHWPWLMKFRRMFGLFVFFYAVIHFMTYVWFDQFFDLNEIIKDIVKRPFITVGFAAFVMLIPLAVTSNKSMIRKLKQNWVKLHKLVYVIAVLGVLHFVWLVKADYLQPFIYGVILLVLLSYRAYQQRKNTTPA
ncbi:MAG: sulfoxide reductase heme-binding subunit YedZ [Gammaproteobacteria bacterium]|nr:sulfoxide reductase heme-binding subunit YedZ [Gammaproteobacteria bacterium]